jgi:peptide/nickel transport system permease protein
MRGAALALFACRRLLLSLPLLLGVVVVNFLLIQLAPGDPVTVLVGDYPAPPAYVRQVRHEFGLDQPVPVRLVRYFEQLGHGNLGYSFANRQPVLSLIGERVGATLELTLTALALAALLGVLLGVLAARHPGTFLDSAVQAISLGGYSVPEFWLGQIMILLFALTLQWLPSQGNHSIRVTETGFAGFLDGLRYLLLPALALSFRYLALISRMTRASMLEVLGSDYILAARSRGASERVILFVHGLRNAAAPVIAVIGYNLGFILAGSALIETVFGWPGIGLLLFTSISRRDYPTMTAILLLVSATVVLANLLTDVVHALVDPRVKQQ